LAPSVNIMSTLTAPQSTGAAAPAALPPGGSPGAHRTPGPGLAARPRLVTRALLLRFASAIGSAISFYLLLSVVPLFAKAGGAGEGAAGLATSALTFAAVAGELVTPRLVTRFGHRWTLAGGLVLLGAPALLLAVSASTTVIVTVCVVRGVGFGITCVSGGALTASIIPAERRGEGLALFGVVVGVPSMVALPAGLWIAAHIGYGPVFAAGAVAALAALAAVPGLPGKDPVDGRSQGLAGRRKRDTPGPGVLAGMRTPELARPSAVFSATTMAAGIVVTFLPLAATRATAGIVTLALLVQPAVSTVTRWLAGRYGDRHGSAGLIIPGVVVSAAGMLMLVLTTAPAAVIAGAVVFGAGFGVAQNATLSLMYARVPESGYGTVSALWNLAYDAGMGLGAAGFGAVAAQTGYPASFALTAALMLTALVPALRDRRAARPH
jgi:predicted MFS family arabinose efflux permease